MDSKMKQNLCKSVNYNCELPVNFDCIIKKKTYLKGVKMSLI